MAGVQEPGLAHRGVEPRALVEEFLLLEARRSSEDNASASGSREPTPSHSPSPLAYAARKVACWTCPGAEESAIGGPEQPSVSTRMMETLPKLYEYECDRHVAVRRTFLPLTVTDELGQRYIAYSLLEPLEGGLGDEARGAVEEERRGDRRNKITHEEGGEATGAFATQSSGSSKLVGRRVVSCQGGAASPLPLGAPSPRAASPSSSARRRTEVRRLLPAYRSHYGNSTMFSCSQSVTLV